MYNMFNFHFEVTDTFGGEANYCWVNRYKIKSKSLKGALVKLSNRTGYNFRSSGLDQWDAKRACVRSFLIDNEYTIEHYYFEEI